MLSKEVEAGMHDLWRKHVSRGAHTEAQQNTEEHLEKLFMRDLRKLIEMAKEQD